MRTGYYDKACNYQCMRLGHCMQPPCPLDTDDELDFDTPRQHTAKVPIFCQQCRKQGRAVYLKGDDPRIIKENGSGYYRGPTMRLTAYLAGAPRVCSACDKQLLAAIDTFSEQE